MIPYRFIALEGADGSGKTSVRKHIFSRLHAAGRELLTLPQHSWLVPEAAEVIVAAKYGGRRVLKNELVDSYLQDKLAAVASLIAPNLPFRHVLADRYVVSDAVYNEVLWGIPHAETLGRYVTAKLLLPDLVVYLDTPPQLAFHRATLRRRGGTDTLHIWDTLAHQEQLYDVFQHVLQCWPTPVVRIDNRGSLEDTLRMTDEEVILPWLATP